MQYKSDTKSRRYSQFKVVHNPKVIQHPEVNLMNPNVKNNSKLICNTKMIQNPKVILFSKVIRDPEAKCNSKVICNP